MTAEEKRLDELHRARMKWVEYGRPIKKAFFFDVTPWTVTPWWQRFFFRKPTFRRFQKHAGRNNDGNTTVYFIREYTEWPGPENPAVNTGPAVNTWRNGDPLRYASMKDYWEDRPVKDD